MEQITITDNFMLFTFPPDKGDMFTKNIYCLINGAEALVIDLAFDDEITAVKNYLAKKHITITTAVVSHYHLDHYYGLNVLSDVTVIGSDVYKTPDKVGNPRFENFLPALAVTDSFYYEFGNFHLEIIAAPGHSPCHLHTIINDRYIHVGDSLMMSSTGTSIYPLVLDTLDHYITTLENLNAYVEYTVLPGHGKPIDNPAKIKTEINNRKIYLENLAKYGKDATLDQCLAGCDDSQFDFLEVHNKNIQFLNKK